MQKIINDPSCVVDEMLQGYAKAHKDLVCATENERVFKYKACPVEGKVGIVTGGGSGHKPAFIGYIGKNMCDAVAIGELFSSPPAQMFYDAIHEADAGKGLKFPKAKAIQFYLKWIAPIIILVVFVAGYFDIFGAK